MQSYDAINAKISAMRGRLLSYGDYYELAGCDTVNSAARRLSKEVGKSYPDFRPPEQEIRRSHIEKSLYFSLAADFAGIRRFITDNGVRSYFNSLFLKNDIRILKLLLSSAGDMRNTGYSPWELSRLFTQRQGIDPERLLSSKNMDGFLDALKDTIFFSVLEKAREGFGSNAVRAGIALDKFYYENLYKHSKAGLSKTNRSVSRSVHGTEIDLLNIITVYRLRTFYKAAPSTITPYLILTGHCRLDKQSILHMAELSGDSLKNEIFSSAYGGVFNDRLSYGEDIEANKLESAYYLGMQKVCKRLAAEKPVSIANTLYYLFQKELEIKNLITLSEGIRYSSGRNEIMKMLIFEKSKAHYN